MDGKKWFFGLGQFQRKRTLNEIVTTMILCIYNTYLIFCVKKVYVLINVLIFPFAHFWFSFKWIKKCYLKILSYS